MAGAQAPSIQAMKKLGWTDAEIAEVLDADRRIDKGEKLFDLDPELEAGAKKARRADRTDTPEKPKREKKVDPDKAKIMSTIDDALCCLVDNVEDRTSDRELLFTYNGKKYKVTLSCPRS